MQIFSYIAGAAGAGIVFALGPGVGAILALALGLELFFLTLSETLLSTAMFFVGFLAIFAFVLFGGTAELLEPSGH